MVSLRTNVVKSIALGEMIVKRSRKNCRALLATALTGSMVLTATGCTTGGSRFASLNPFSKAKAPAPALQKEPGVTESIAEDTKTMWKRSGKAVTGMFASVKKKARDTETNPDIDPLSLENPTELSAEVLVANGRLWESTGNTTKAMENYTKALEVEADYADALTNIARLHFRQGNHTQAADFFGRAIKKNPEDAGLYNDLGLTLSKMGNYAAAEQALSRALELAPGTSRYANNLASVRFESGDKAGAMKVLEANNKPAVAHFNIAYLHYKGGQMQDAQKHLAEVMKFESRSGQDSSVKQAVDRSRQMLAQLAGPQATIAQAPPAIPSAKSPASGIRQTSQSSASDAKAAVTSAAGPTSIPSAEVIRPSLGIEQLKSSAASIPPSMRPAAPAATTEKLDDSATTEPEAKPQAEASPTAAETFSLPPSFQMPTE